MPQVLAKDLRESVLEYGLLGKLTEHNSNETVTDLLRQAESFHSLNPSKKKIASIDYDSITDDIPNNWEWIQLGKLADVIRGLTFSVSYKEKKDNTTLVLRGGNIDSVTEEISLIDNIYVDKDIVKPEQLVKKNDTLIVASSGTKSSVGKSSLITKDYDNVSFGGFMMIIRPNGVLDPKIISWHLKRYRQKIISDTVGYISNITYPILANLLIPLPPIEEQARIVARVEELMAKIDEYEEIENELVELKSKFPTDMKDAILQAAMQGKLTQQSESDVNIYEYLEDVVSIKNSLLKEKKIKKDKTTDIVEDEYPFDIPDNWVWTKLGILASLRPGKTPPRAEPVWWGKPTDVPWVSIADMVADGHVSKTKEFISKVGFEEKFKGNISPAGTMIMSFKLTVGRVSYLDIDALHNEAIISIFPFKDDEHILQSYLFKVLPYLTQYGDSKNAIKGETLNAESLCNLYIPLPPIEEQQRIVEKLDQLLPLCEELEKETA